MDAGTAIWFSAVIGAVGGVIVAFIQNMKKENHSDHQVVQGILRTMHRSQSRMEDKIDKVSDRLTTHIENHAD